MCEAFTIPPVAGGALDQPVMLTGRILLLRRYKAAWEMVNKKGPYEHLESYTEPEWARDLVGDVLGARAVYEAQCEADAVAAEGLEVAP